MTTPTDSIQRSVLLHAPIERVWRAVSDSREFGTWFGARFRGPFTAGSRVAGEIVPTEVDEEVAEKQREHAGTPFEIQVESVVPMRQLSFRWLPFGVDPEADAEREPTTLVTFTLEARDGGTLLTITETGFDRIPIERRARAFESNAEGWTAQLTLIRKYLARTSGE